MMFPPSGPPLTNHEQCSVRALLLFCENGYSYLKHLMGNCNKQNTVKIRKNAEIRDRETLLINKITELWFENCGIKSERLARPLVSITRHVYGAQHSYTKQVEEVLAKDVKCYVSFLTVTHHRPPPPPATHPPPPPPTTQ